MLTHTYSAVSATGSGASTQLSQSMSRTGRQRGTPGKYDADIGGSLTAIEKQEDGRFIVWGPASVEVVDKEDDLVRADALEEALPQLLKRARLSLDHSDQLVGEILEGYETDEPVTVEVDGQKYTRSEFPTGVLYPEEDDVPLRGLYVCGEIYDDTQVARDTRERIESGEYDSFSISGEALSSATQFENGGDVIDRIEEVDLSAVTICEEGMNQNAKFALIDKNQEYDVQQLRDSLPDDLFEEVKDHLTDPEDKPPEDVMGVDGEQEVDEVRDEEQDEEGSVEKMFTPYDHTSPVDFEVEDQDSTGALAMGE